MNMNPFEDGMVNANAFHGVMTRQIAMKETRSVQTADYPFFYNPMWGFFGDGTPGPAGTNHFSRSQHREFFWNMFDQFLVRPALFERFKNADLEILDTDGTTCLLTRIGLPNKEKFSDHLPIRFRLDL